MTLIKTFLATALLLSPLMAVADQSPSVFFITPHDGDVVSGEFTVQFGLKGMGVAPAGVDKEHTGHHHLLIDLDTLPALDAPLPADDHILHFGGGQTQTTLSLPAGEHTLQLLLGDYAHVPMNPTVISEKITITVE